MLRLRVKQTMADAVAIGRVWRYRAGAYAPSGRVVPSGERPAEQSRFDAAVAAAEGELEKLAAANEIFAAHLELAADPMLMENVAEKIAEGMTARRCRPCGLRRVGGALRADRRRVPAGARRRCTRRMSPHPAAVGAFRDRSFRRDSRREHPRRRRTGTVGYGADRFFARARRGDAARQRDEPSGHSGTQPEPACRGGVGRRFRPVGRRHDRGARRPAGELLIAPDEHTAAEYRRRMEEARGTIRGCGCVRIAAGHDTRRAGVGRAGQCRQRG